MSWMECALYSNFFCNSDSISKIFSSSCESKAQGFEFSGVETVSFMSEPPTLITLETHQGQFSSVQSLSCVWFFATPWTAATPGVYSNSCPLSRWCHPTISFSVIPFSSCPQSFPASGSFQRSQLFASSGQNIGVSTSTSVLPVNIQDWFPLGQTGWISLRSKGLSRVFSNTTVQKHQFFGAQLSL